MYDVNLIDHKPKHGNRFHCEYCGRFAHFITSYFESNSNGTDLVIEWKCSQCGHCKEGKW